MFIHRPVEVAPKWAPEGSHVLLKVGTFKLDHNCSSLRSHEQDLPEMLQEGHHGGKIASSIRIEFLRIDGEFVMVFLGCIMYLKTHMGFSRCSQNGSRSMRVSSVHAVKALSTTTTCATL